MTIEKKFNHLKVHTQYSICEGAIKISDLQSFCKKQKITSVGISDTHNLCGALEFSDLLSKIGTHPIIGTQINIKFKNTTGLLCLIAVNETGYKNIIKLSSISYLLNDTINLPYCDLSSLLEKNEGIIVLSGTINGLSGLLFDKGKTSEVKELYSLIKSSFKDRFYIEIQRHNDFNENIFEKFNLNLSNILSIPIIATQEVFYIDKSMYEAHDALICIGGKTYLNEKKRLKYSNQHYFKNTEEMKKLFLDLPEALENNFNLPYRCSFRPKFS